MTLRGISKRLGFKDGVSAPTTGSNIQVAAGGRRLYVLKGDLPNQGVYTCIVRNSAGESRKSFQLIVLGKFFLF